MSACSADQILDVEEISAPKNNSKRDRENFKKKYVNATSYHWMATWHDTSVLPSPALFVKDDKHKLPVVAFIYQVEIAPTTKKKHFQCYFEFFHKASFKKIQLCLGKNNKDSYFGHWEIRRGTHQQAYDYCSKTETRENPLAEPITFGKFTVELEEKKEEKSEKLSKAIQAINQGKTIEEVWRIDPKSYLKFRSNLICAINDISPKRSWVPEVIILYGPTGCGKSRWAQDNYPNAYIFQCPSIGKQEWWPSYYGHETVVINEFYGQLGFDYLLNLLDRYAMTVQTKGGFANFCATRVIFTTNTRPDYWYINQKKPDGSLCDFEILRRRVTKAFAFKFIPDPNKKEVKYEMVSVKSWQNPDKVEDVYKWHEENNSKMYVDFPQ